MTDWAKAIDAPTLIVGDFNIAPMESDVWNHKQLLKVVSHTPIEVETLQGFKDAHGWVDLGREFIRDPDRYYSWWSYRSKDWRVNDRGRRLDHMWASPPLAAKATGHRLLEDARSWEKPSDHIPLVTEFDVWARAHALPPPRQSGARPRRSMRCVMAGRWILQAGRCCCRSKPPLRAGRPRATS